MALCVCEYCGKPFNGFGSSVCAECISLLEEYYLKARKYIYQNPRDAKFLLIVENADIPEKALRFLIREGRILLEDKAGSGLKCKVCGKEAPDGQLCKQCRGKLYSQKFFSETGRTGNSDKKNTGTGVLPLNIK